MSLSLSFSLAVILNSRCVREATEAQRLNTSSIFLFACTLLIRYTSPVIIVVGLLICHAMRADLPFCF